MAICAILGSLASGAFAHVLKSVTATGCKSVTFYYIDFPTANGNTVHEVVTAPGGQTIGSGTGVFNGPKGYSTIPITGGYNGEIVTATSTWNTNGVKSGTPPPSFQVKLSCPCPPPVPDTADANASGNATGLIANVPLLDLSRTESQTSSTEHGLGTDSNNNVVNTISVPDVLTAAVIPVTSTSTVSSGPAEADDLSTAETTGLNVLNGVVTASVVRGVAEATATGSSESTSSAGTQVSGLDVQGTTYNTTTPGEVIDLVPQQLGLSTLTGTVTVDEETRSGTTASGLSGGTYSADLKVNALDIELSLKPPMGPAETISVIISQAVAHADFPQTAVCLGAHVQEVSGNAFVASEVMSPATADVTSGYAGIPSTGGSGAATLSTFGTAPLVSGGGATSTSSGALTATDSSSQSQAAISNKVCLLGTTGSCEISADAIDSDSATDANAGGASSGDTGTTFTNLMVNGITIPANPAPNTTITLPGIGYVVINQQTCDDGTEATHTCTGAAGHSGLTVEALDVVIEQSALGFLPGTQVIVAEAHSDATFQ